jgi:hypothetical protein
MMKQTIFALALLFSFMTPLGMARRSSSPMVAPSSIPTYSEVHRMGTFHIPLIQTEMPDRHGTFVLVLTKLFPPRLQDGVWTKNTKSHHLLVPTKW